MAQTGVGLTLAPHAPSGALKVTALDPEGPAARGGLIQAGDVLFDVRDPSRFALAVGPMLPALPERLLPDSRRQIAVPAGDPPHALY